MTQNNASSRTTTTFSSTPAGASLNTDRNVNKPADSFAPYEPMTMTSPDNEPEEAPDTAFEKVKHEAAEALHHGETTADEGKAEGETVFDALKEKASDITDAVKEKAEEIKDDFTERREEAEAEREAEIEAQAADPAFNLSVNEGVIEKIAAIAVQRIDGVLDMKGSMLSMIQEGLGGTDRAKGVSATSVDARNARVDLSVIMEYGASAATIFEEAKDLITRDVKNMTDMNVIEMNLQVVDVMTKEEFEKKQSGGLAGFLGADDDSPAKAKAA